MIKREHTGNAVVAVLLAVCALLPYFVLSAGWTGFAINILIFSLLALAWNITGGFGGMMSFGHAVLFGSSAYATAMLQLHLGLNAWLAGAVALAVGAMVGGFIGALTFRYGLRGSYFALVTLAFAEVFRVLASSFAVTGGGQGLSLPLGRDIANLQFASRLDNYSFVLILVLIALAITIAVRRSRFGAYLIAIRENEEAAKALGINTFRVKVLAMTLSGAMAGAAGVAYLQTFLFVDAQIGFGTVMSFEALLGPIIGGAGTVLGPILGSLVLHTLGEIARESIGGAPGLNLVFYGVVLLIILRFLPDGLMGLFKPRSRADAKPEDK